MNHPKLLFKASADIGHITIDGTIGEDWWADDCCNTFRKIADIISDIQSSGCNSYHVKIHSLGGDVDHALAIYTMLSQLPNVTTEIVGMCASAATVIFMAGTTRIMDSSALFLVHHAWSGARGNAQQIERTVETLKTIDETMVSIYANTTGLSAEEVRELMDANDGDGKWITADECKRKNFCTAVTSKPQASVRQQYFALADIKTMQLPIPEQMEELSPSTWSKIKNLITSLTKPTPIMKKNIVAAYACLAVIFSELMEDENGNVTLKAEDLQKVEDQLAAGNAKVAELEEKVKNLEESIKTSAESYKTANAQLAEANAKVAELQALIDKTPQGKTPVNGLDNQGDEEFNNYVENSTAYAQAEETLRNY